MHKDDVYLAIISSIIYDQSINHVSQETTQTSDVIGNDLSNFSRRSDLNHDEMPLVFWLLAYYFKSKPERFHAAGVFRINYSDEHLLDLETYMSHECYSYLEEIESPHIVACYWKKVLR